MDPSSSLFCSRIDEWNVAATSVRLRSIRFERMYLASLRENLLIHIMSGRSPCSLTIVKKEMSLTPVITSKSTSGNLSSKRGVKPLRSATS